MDLASEPPPNYSPNGLLDLLYAGKKPVRNWEEA